MATLSLSRAREGLGDAVNTVAYGRERVIIQRNGKDVAALVPMSDLELLRRMEDEVLGREAERRLQDPADAVVSNAEAIKELGLESAKAPAGPRGRAPRAAGRKVRAQLEKISD